MEEGGHARRSTGWTDGTRGPAGRRTHGPPVPRKRDGSGHGGREARRLRRGRGRRGARASRGIDSPRAIRGARARRGRQARRLRRGAGEDPEEPSITRVPTPRVRARDTTTTGSEPLPGARCDTRPMTQAAPAATPDAHVLIVGGGRHRGRPRARPRAPRAPRDARRARRVHVGDDRTPPRPAAQRGALRGERPRVGGGVHRGEPDPPEDRAGLVRGERRARSSRSPTRTWRTSRASWRDAPRAGIPAQELTPAQALRARADA